MNLKSSKNSESLKIESTKEIQGQMTDTEIKSELIKDKNFLAALEDVKESFLNSWKDFEKSDSFNTLKKSYPDVIDKVDLTNIPLRVAQRIALENGIDVYKHNLTTPDDPWSYGFSFPKDSMFKFFENSVERNCLKALRKHAIEHTM